MTSLRRCLALGALTIAALAALSPAAVRAASAPSWTQTSQTTVSERRGAVEAYDPVTSQLVLFGGDNSVNTLDDTWVFAGDHWNRLHTAHAPMARTNSAMVFDPTTGTLILFGGDPHIIFSDGTSYLADTWSFDGTDWTHLNPTHRPGSRSEEAMAWDAAEGRIVLFGGLTDATGFGQDTWTFDGTDWTQQSPATVPPARHGAMMSYVGATSSVVMFGGLGTPPTGSTSPYLSDTWSWQGGNWTQVASPAPTSAVTGATTPQGRWAGVMAPTANGSAVLFGGYWDSGLGSGPTPGTHVNGPSSTLGDAWEYGASGWTQLSSTALPASRYQSAMAWDPALNADVLYGGCCNAPGGFFTDTWLFDGSTWSEHERTDAPSVRSGAEAVSDTDHNDVVMFGGFGGPGFLGDTWVESAGHWSPVPAGTTAPIGRFAASMAYDSTRHQTVLFGGQAQSANQCSNTIDQLDVNHLCNDTWTFDGSTWTKAAAASANPPPYRSLGVMAYDPATDRTVLFGGFADGTELGDTWNFDGTSWSQVTPATSPPARHGSTLVYDPSLGQLVLFGGEGTDANGNVVTFNDTWAWNGTTWTQLTTAVTPPGLYEAGATWDPELGGVLLVGGQSPSGTGVFGTSHDAWLFSRGTWVREATTTAPGDRSFAPLAWDPAGGAVIVGGQGNDGLSDDTWALSAAPATDVPEAPAPALLTLLGAGPVALAVNRRRGRAGSAAV